MTIRTRWIAGAVAWSVLISGGLYVAAQAPASPAIATISVQAGKPGAAISPTLFGVFFEDINFAADGGLYAERIKNRSFEFPDPLMGWKRAAVDNSRGSFAVGTTAPPSAQNPHYLRITSTAASFGVTNDGFRGIAFRKGDRFKVSLLARLAGHAKADATTPVTLRVELENTGNRPLGGVTLTGFTRQWQRYTGTIVAENNDGRARLRVVLQTPPSGGAVDVDMISMFPEDTWQGRENGLRRDLVELLRDLRPGFIRFPGGCIVEGRFLDGRYQWKTTIGNPGDRKTIINRWNDEFPHRAAPDYYQSFGLGFFEYFQLSEDLGAEPLPIINCGMACQFNSNELAPLDGLDEYIQDALDLIEFANGPPTSTWGRRRVEMGHPAPFNMKFIGVGNEQWGQQYLDRYDKFAAVLKKKHPEIKLVASAGPFASGDRFDLLWKRWREVNPDLVDEHYYMPPNWFLENVRRYDTYPRTGPKIFAGEYAAHAPSIPARGGQRPSTLTTAIAEAAFMTGLERNADIVDLSSYAPLLAHVDAWQWSPNLIWFDNLRSYGTTSYYVQKLFGSNRGTNVLPLTIDGSAQNGGANLFASASLDAKAREVIIKVVNPTAMPRTVKLDVGGVSGGGKAFVLTGEPNGENTLDAPTAIAPTEQAVSGGEQALPAHSLMVLRLPIK